MLVSECIINESNIYIKCTKTQNDLFAIFLHFFSHYMLNMIKSDALN